jgi:hypothetical protein
LLLLNSNRRGETGLAGIALPLTHVMTFEAQGLNAREFGRRFLGAGLEPDTAEEAMGELPAAASSGKLEEGM